METQSLNVFSSWCELQASQNFVFSLKEIPYAMLPLSLGATPADFNKLSNNKKMIIFFFNRVILQL